MGAEQCARCKQLLLVGDGILVGAQDADELVCTRCFNGAIANHLSVEFIEPTFVPVLLTDYAGIERRFRFFTRLVPAGVLLVAREELEDGDLRPGYELSLLGRFDADLMELFTELFWKLRRTVVEWHVEREDGEPVALRSDQLTGRVIAQMAEGPLLEVDGDAISWSELGNMLAAYEGFEIRRQLVSNRGG